METGEEIVVRPSWMVRGVFLMSEKQPLAPSSYAADRPLRWVVSAVLERPFSEPSASGARPGQATPEPGWGAPARTCPWSGDSIVLAGVQARLLPPNAVRVLVLEIMCVAPVKGRRPGNSLKLLWIDGVPGSGRRNAQRRR